MLSTKVIYAIETLNELAVCKPNSAGRRVKRLSDICHKFDMEPFVCRSVVRNLNINNYIDSSSSGYSLSRDANTISVYELIELFHGGIVIGELNDDQSFKGNYESNPMCRKAVHFEKMMAKKLKKMFSAVNVADLGSDKD